MAKAKLFKANLNYIVKAETGEQIMGATPEAAAEQFKALWATHYPGVECPEIERDEALDIQTGPDLSNPEASIQEVKKDEAPQPTADEVGRPFTMEELHAALTEGEKLQRAYAPAFAHPLLQAGAEVDPVKALEAVRSLERGLSATTGRAVKLL